MKEEEDGLLTGEDVGRCPCALVFIVVREPFWIATAWS